MAFYKSIRTTVEHGKPYRLERPGQSESSQVQYVAENGSQSVLFAYPRSQHYGIEPLDSEKYQGELTIPGAQLMGQGLKLKLSVDYDPLRSSFGACHGKTPNNALDRFDVQILPCRDSQM